MRYGISDGSDNSLSYSLRFVAEFCVRVCVCACVRDCLCLHSMLVCMPVWVSEWAYVCICVCVECVMVYGYSDDMSGWWIWRIAKVLHVSVVLNHEVPKQTRRYTYTSARARYKSYASVFIRYTLETLPKHRAAYDSSAIFNCEACATFTQISCQVIFFFFLRPHFIWNEWAMRKKSHMGNISNVFGTNKSAVFKHCWIYQIK